jgi:amino acid adenylation domain-containing protein
MNRPDGSDRLDTEFDAQAARTPHAIALIDGDGETTYAELDDAANRIARLIRSSGVPDGAFVGVHMERSRHHVASVLGAFKANVAAVPLPPSYPLERLRDILSFANLAAVLVDRDIRHDPPLHARQLDIRDAVDASVSLPAPGERDPNRAAYVLCSSGSTGKPKLIVRSHRSFFHRLRWTWNTHPYDLREVCCQKAHMTTTHAVYELFEPLLRGVPVVIVSDLGAKTLETFWETIRRRSISRLLIVPSVLQASLDMPDFVAPPNIGVLVLMGEYVNPKLAARTAAAFPEATRIYSIYGSTEASSTLLCDVRAGVARGGELSLGAPISRDVRAEVLDDTLAPVADGADGMLYIAGSALFSGYFGDAALTDAAFATLANGERVYRTNDRVRRDADGALTFLGRVDHTVKVRGFRVDLQEVENAIARAPSVRQSAVVVADDHDGNAMLVGFVSPASGPTSSVFQALREHLPDYMVPSRVIALDALPLTTSGKIDRRALLETWASQRAAATTVSIPVRSQTEREVANAWSAVLGHSAFAIDSNFFEVGGTSLKTFSLMSKLQNTFGLDRRQLSDNTIYRVPTLEGLARFIEDIRAGRAPDAVSETSALVTLKNGSDANAAPVFMISSAGGTLGAYEKLVKVLATKREVIGVRDPFLWGERDPTQPFRDWAGIYLDAIRARQPKGPYYVVAYSSAGAFGYEIARRLRAAGEDVALLGLIDPLAIDSRDKRRFGHFAFEARFKRAQFASALRFARSLYQRVFFRKSEPSAFANDFAFSREEFDALQHELMTNQKHLLQVSALMELNTGLPLALRPEDLAALAPERYFDAFFAKIAAAIPDVDREMIERLVVQYQLQVRSQHRYRLQWYDGTVELFDPAGPWFGLLRLLFQPYVRDLSVHRVALGEPDDRTRELGKRFSNSVRSHFLSMRDDAFVAAVARVLEKCL